MTPLSRAGLLAAKTANVLVIEVLQAVLIIGTGIALGWDATAGILPALGLLLIGTVAFAGIGMLMAGTLRAEANLAAANGLFLVLLFLGGMAYPLDKLPNAIEVFAKALPAAALAECVRGVLASPSHLPVGELFVLLAWAIGAPLVAIRFFRWEESRTLNGACQADLTWQGYRLTLMKPIKYRDLTKLLRSLDCEHIRTKGDHEVWRAPGRLHHGHPGRQARRPGNSAEHPSHLAGCLGDDWLGQLGQ